MSQRSLSSYIQLVSTVSVHSLDYLEINSIECTKVEGHEMGHTSRRRISLALILGLNAAWLYAVACASLCAAGVCPNETTPAMSEHCHQEQSPGPNHQGPGHEQNCLLHGHPTNSFLVPAGNQTPPDLQALACRIFPSVPITLFADGPIASLDTSSHSPPGFSTGRTICQKQSLLRI